MVPLAPQAYTKPSILHIRTGIAVSLTLKRLVDKQKGKKPLLSCICQLTILLHHKKSICPGYVTTQEFHYTAEIYKLESDSYTHEKVC
jgi:hypothetical protein